MIDLNMNFSSMEDFSMNNTGASYLISHESATIIHENGQTYTFPPAKEMIKKYKDHTRPFLIIDPTDPTKLKVFRGLRVDRQDIERLFNDPDVREIYISFGVAGLDIHKAEKDQNFTTILYGVKHENDDPKKAMIDTSTVVNFCDPCPPKCPVNVDTILT